MTLQNGPVQVSVVDFTAQELAEYYHSPDLSGIGGNDRAIFHALILIAKQLEDLNWLLHDVAENLGYVQTD